MKSPRRTGWRNSHSEGRAVPVVVDTDGGIDDAVALALAAGSPEVDVVAVTTVFGNVDVSRATRNVRFIAERVDLTAPVVAGAATPLRRSPDPPRGVHGAEGLGHVVPEIAAAPEADRAAEHIAMLARSTPRLGVCALGPLTNLARALSADPGIADRLGSIVAMGGALEMRGAPDRAAEFNWWSDPEAVHVVVSAGLDLRCVPIDVTRRVTLSAEDLRAMREARDPLARLWGAALGYRFDGARRVDPDAGCPLHDPVAVALAIAPELAEWRTLRLTIETADGPDRGVARRSADGAPIRIAVDVNAEEVMDLLRARVPSLFPGG